MNRRAILAIAAKDVREVRHSRQMVLSLVLVPFLFVVVLPALFILAPQHLGVQGSTTIALDQLAGSLPPSIRGELAPYTEIQQVVYLGTNYLFAPLFLVIPLMVSNIIAASSFAGERERHTIEGLLYAPVTDRELFVAKSLAALVPAVAVAAIGFAGYTLVVDALAYPLFGHLLLPNALWLVLVLWVVPAVSFLGLGVTVLVSTRARGVQEAQQIAGIVVLPLVALVYAQLSGLLFLTPELLALVGAGFYIVDAALVVASARVVTRDRFLARAST